MSDLMGREHCSSCGGTGWEDGGAVCLSCGGKGYYEYYIDPGYEYSNHSGDSDDPDERKKRKEREEREQRRGASASFAGLMVAVIGGIAGCAHTKGGWFGGTIEFLVYALLSWPLGWIIGYISARVTE